MNEAGKETDKDGNPAQSTEQAGPPVGDADTPVPERFGSYRILDVISSSQMAYVYKAEQETPRRIVALKIPRCGNLLTRETRERFLREVALASDIDHSGIVTVLEAGEKEGVPYYTMPFIDGRSLDGYLKIEQPDLAVRLDLFQRICQVVDALHQKGLIHRDLKPGNLMIDRHGDVRLLDFGLARSSAADDMLLTGTACVGTPLFMAPEQTLPGQVAITTAADVYSLGVILYWLLADTLPYILDGNKYVAIETIRKHVPEAPSRCKPELSGAYDRLVLSCLDKNPARRPQNAGELKQELQYIIGNPASARAREWRRRCLRFGKAAAAIMGVALLAASAAFLVRMPHGDPWKLDEVQTVAPAYSLSGVPMFLGNASGGGRPDLIEENEGKIHIRSAQVLDQISQTINVRDLVGSNAALSGMADIMGDTRDEFLLSWSDDTSMYCGVMNQFRYVQKKFYYASFVARQDGNIIGSSRLRVWGMLPPAQGLGSRLLVVADCGFGGGPRGILCFDWESESLLWKNFVGPLLDVESGIAWDVDHDGADDVIMGSFTPGNGAVGEDGTQDTESWIFAWSGKTGQPLWKRRVGGVFLQTILFTPTTRAGKVLCAWVHGRDYPYGLGTTAVHALSEDGKVLRTYGPDIGSRSCMVHPGPNQSDELILGDNEGRLSFIDPATMALRQRVDILKREPNWDKVVMALGSADMDGDGEKEVIVAAHGQVHVGGDNPGQPWQDPNVVQYKDVHVAIIKSSGAILAQREFAYNEMKDPQIRIFTGDFVGDSSNEALLMMDKGHLLRLAR